MAERNSALASCYRPGSYGAPGHAAVTLQLQNGLQLQQVAAWPETVNLIEAQALEAIAAHSPPAFGQAVVGGFAALLRIEPLKWWMLGGVMPVPDAESGVVLDLSHSRVQLLISGASAIPFLNRFMPLDLRASSCPVGSVMSGAIHHVGITLWHSSRGYELFVPRGFSVSVYELLCEGAEQFGLEVLPELDAQTF